MKHKMVISSGGGSSIRSFTWSQLGTYSSTMVRTQKNAPSKFFSMIWRTSTTSTRTRRV